MSSYAMGVVWKAQLEPKMKMLLLRVADVAGETGVYFESMETIAERTGFARSTVATMLRQARESGWLEQIEPGGGRGHSARYRLALETLPKPSEARTVPDDKPSGRLPPNRPGAGPELRTEPRAIPLANANGSPSPLGRFIDAYRASHNGADPTTAQRGPFQRWASRAEADGRPREVMLQVAEFAGTFGYSSAGWFNKALANLDAGRPIASGFPGGAKAEDETWAMLRKAHDETRGGP